MMDKIEALLRKMADTKEIDAARDREEMSNDAIYDEWQDLMNLITEGAALHKEMSQLIEVAVFGMSSVEQPGKEPDHYDVVVSIKSGDEIHEIDENEGVGSENLDLALNQMAAKYPHATVIDPRG